MNFDSKSSNISVLFVMGTISLFDILFKSMIQINVLLGLLLAIETFEAQFSKSVKWFITMLDNSSFKSLMHHHGDDGN